VKTVTLTALVALLVSVPLVLRIKKLEFVANTGGIKNLPFTDDNLRYDIDDFLT